MYYHQMEHPGRLIVKRSWPARAKNRPALFEYFRFHKEVTEGGMQFVRSSRREYNLGIAGYLNNAALARTVRERDPAKLNIILWRNSYFRVGLNIFFAAAELDFCLGKNGFIRFQRFCGWLI